MVGCKETVHAQRCHWFDISAAFTAKADVWSTAQASGNGRPKDHSWHSERNAKAEYNWTIQSIQSQATCHWPGSYRFEHERWPISVTWRKCRLFYGLAKNLRGTVPVHRYMRNCTGPRTGVVKNRWSRSLSLPYILSSKVSFSILFLHFSIRCTLHNRKDYDEQKAVVVSKRHYQGCHLNAKRARIQNFPRRLCKLLKSHKMFTPFDKVLLWRWEGPCNFIKDWQVCL